MNIQSINSTNFKGGIQSKEFISAVQRASTFSSDGQEINKLFSQCQKKLENLGIDVFVTPPALEPIDSDAEVIKGKTPLWHKSIFTEISFKYDKAQKALKGKLADKTFRLNLSGIAKSLTGGYITNEAIAISTDKYPDVKKVLHYIDTNTRYLSINKKAGVYYTHRQLPLTTKETFRNEFHYSPEEVEAIVTHKNITAYTQSKDFVPSKTPLITGATRLFSQNFQTDPVVLCWVDKEQDPGIRIEYGHNCDNSLSEHILYTNEETRKIRQKARNGELIGYCSEPSLPPDMD